MENLKEELIQILTDGSPLKEIDAMGREKFWEDIGRKND